MTVFDLWILFPATIILEHCTNVTAVINAVVVPHGSEIKLSDPAVLVEYLWWLRAGPRVVTDKWPHWERSAPLKTWQRKSTKLIWRFIWQGYAVRPSLQKPTTVTDLSSRAFCSVRQATNVPLMNMWHMMTWQHFSMKVSVADGSKVPFREIRQTRWRREQQDRASKKDALAFR